MKTMIGAGLVTFGLVWLYSEAPKLYGANGSADARAFDYATASVAEQRAFLELVATNTADSMRPENLGSDSDLLKTRSVTGVMDHDAKTIRIKQIVGADLLTVETRDLLETRIFKQNCPLMLDSNFDQIGLSIELDAKNDSGQQFYRVLLSPKTCASFLATAQLQKRSSE